MTQFRQFAESVTSSKLENNFKRTRNKIALFVSVLLSIILLISGLSSFHQQKRDFERSRPFKISRKVLEQPIDKLPLEIREEITMVSSQTQKEVFLEQLLLRIILNNFLLWVLLTLLTWLALYWLLKPLQDVILEKERFLDSASHELRTPLAIMKSELSLADKASTKEELLDAVETTKSQVNKLAVLSDTLLNRLEGTGVQTEINVKKTVDKVFKSLTKETGVLKNNVGKNFIVNINSELFEQLIYNIFDNAIKHSDPKRVEVLNDGKSLKIINLTNQKSEFIPGIGLGVQLELAKVLGISLKHAINDNKFIVEIKLK